MQLTDNFKLDEFACHCGCNEHANYVQNLTELAQALELDRKAYGKPMKIFSGFRCAAHNTAVGGVKNSYHLKGLAADLHAEDTDDLARLHLAVLRGGGFPGGVGLYKSNPLLLHRDVRGIWIFFNR